MDPEWEANARLYIVGLHEAGVNIEEMMQRDGRWITDKEAEAVTQMQKASPEVHKVTFA